MKRKLLVIGIAAISLMLMVGLMATEAIKGEKEQYSPMFEYRLNQAAEEMGFQTKEINCEYETIEISEIEVNYDCDYNAHNTHPLQTGIPTICTSPTCEGTVCQGGTVCGSTCSHTCGSTCLEGCGETCGIFCWPPPECTSGYTCPYTCGYTCSNTCGYDCS